MYYVIETGMFVGSPIAGRVLAAWTTLPLAIGDFRGRRKRAARTRVLVDSMTIVESSESFMRAELVPALSVERAFNADGEPVTLWFSPPELPAAAEGARAG